MNEIGKSNHMDTKIAARHDKWLRERYRPEALLKGERREFKLDIGIPVAPIYTPASLEECGFDFEEDSGFPGEFPFTRGDTATMFRTEPFVVSAYSGYGDAKVCNERLRHLINLGVEQLLVAMDLPTQCGYDADDVMSAAEVGRVGVSIDSLADMEELFAGIPLDSVKRVGTLGNSIGPIVLALFAALGEKQGIDWSRYVVNLQNDVLKEYIARGTQILPPEPAARLAADCVEWCVENAPHWSPMTVCCNHLNAGGAGSSSAASIALGHALQYLDDLVARGHDIEKIAPLIHMFPDERHDFFTSIANLRALRKIWATVLSDRYDARTERALGLKTTVYGHGQETIQEPLNNVVRIGFGTLAYVFGGASYVYIASFDEAISTPSVDAVRVAVRTQQIIADEFGFTDTIDPLGGSYFVETLTKSVEDQIRNGLNDILASGGALTAIHDGSVRRILRDGANRRQESLDTGQRPWVTVNCRRVEPSVPNTAFRIDSACTERQIQKTEMVRNSRNETAVRNALSVMRQALDQGANVVPSTLDAVRAYATIGEICTVWRQKYGEFERNTDF